MEPCCKYRINLLNVQFQLLEVPGVQRERPVLATRSIGVVWYGFSTLPLVLMKKCLYGT